MCLQQQDIMMLDGLTFSEKMLHLLTCLVIVDEDVKTKALEALVQLAGVSVRTIAYIHPCLEHTHHPLRLDAFARMTSDTIRSDVFSLPVFSSKFLLLMMIHFPTRWWLILYWNDGETILYWLSEQSSCSRIWPSLFFLLTNSQKKEQCFCSFTGTSTLNTLLTQLVKY